MDDPENPYTGNPLDLLIRFGLVDPDKLTNPEALEELREYTQELVRWNPYALDDAANGRLQARRVKDVLDADIIE